MINDMMGHIRGAIGQMEGLRYALLKLPKSARKNILMDAMDDYLAELNNTLSNMDQSNKIVAANLLSDYQNNEAERQRVRENKREVWGLWTNKHGTFLQWDLTVDWLTMTNDLFFEKYGFNWTPSITLQDDVKAFMNKYGNITEDDLKKPYGALEKTKTPTMDKVIKSIIESRVASSDLIGLSCPTKSLNQEIIRKFTEDRIDPIRYITEGFAIKERPTNEITENQINDIADKLKDWTTLDQKRPSGLTQNQLNTLGGLNSPNYNLYR